LNFNESGFIYIYIYNSRFVLYYTSCVTARIELRRFVSRMFSRDDHPGMVCNVQLETRRFGDPRAFERFTRITIGARRYRGLRSVSFSLRNSRVIEYVRRLRFVKRLGYGRRATTVIEFRSRVTLTITRRVPPTPIPV